MFLYKVKLNLYIETSLEKNYFWFCNPEAGIKRMDVPLKDILTNPFNKDFYNLGDEKLEFELGAYIKQIFKLYKAELSSPDEDLVIVKRKKDRLIGTFEIYEGAFLKH